MVNSSKICVKNQNPQNYGLKDHTIDYFLRKINQQQSYISSLKTSLKNANNEQLKCELKKEVTTTRIVLTSSSEKSPENQFTSIGCQDLTRTIDGFSREIQQQEAHLSSFKEFLIKDILNCSKPIKNEPKVTLVSHSVRIFKPALTTPISYPECPANQVYRSGACRDLIKRNNFRSMLQPIPLTTRNPSLKTD